MRLLLPTPEGASPLLWLTAKAAVCKPELWTNARRAGHRQLKTVYMHLSVVQFSDSRDVRLQMMHPHMPQHRIGHNHRRSTACGQFHQTLPHLVCHDQFHP